MNLHHTSALAQQHRTEILNHAAEARLARTIRKNHSNPGSTLRSLVARFARPAHTPVVVAPVATLPTPAERSIAA